MNKKIVTIGNTDQGFSFSHNQTQLSLSLIKFQFFICHYLYFLIVPYSFKNQGTGAPSSAIHLAEDVHKISHPCEMFSLHLLTHKIYGAQTATRAK